MSTTHCWDYLVLTASNALQARAYEEQLCARRELGLLPAVRETMVIADLEGKRIGSGGSTLLCLMEILRRERARRGIELTPDSIRTVLSESRILIVHAGGDSRRLPAYAPCGKIFVPLPGASDSPLPLALFDRLVPSFLALPSGLPGAGQVVVAAGDALIRFDPRSAALTSPGLIALGVQATPEEASRHGVFCLAPDGAVSHYLQKPSIEAQRRAGAISSLGRTPLDIGVMHMDGCAATMLLLAFGVECSGDTGLDFRAEARARILECSLDLYREICCGLGRDTSFDDYVTNARASGSTWPEDVLEHVFPGLHVVPFHVELLPECRFLHFGTTRQLIESGLALMAEDGAAIPSTVLEVASIKAGAGVISGTESWVEGCRISAPLRLPGLNVLVGLDLESPLALPRGACLEVLRGVSRRGEETWFLRFYGVDDTFKDSLLEGARFCGRPMLQWLGSVKADPQDIWPDVDDSLRRSLWNARVFPCVSDPAEYRKWLWAYEPASASAEALRAFRESERYSAAEIALLADQTMFYARRTEIWRSIST